jgi:hypothetical protein
VLVFDAAGRALHWAAGYIDIFGIPIYLWVMVVKPVVPQDYAPLTQASDCKLSALRVVVIVADKVTDFDYHACLICHTINIVDWDEIGEQVCGDVI